MDKKSLAVGSVFKLPAAASRPTARSETGSPIFA